MSAARRGFLIDVAVVLLGCLVAWLAYFGPLLTGPTDVPGDLGDARFNLYVLEHVFRWLSGNEPSLLSPPMFWPYPLTLGFSDTHAGTFWIYALLRAVGLDQYQSFALWVVLGYFATYAAAYVVLRKFSLGPLLAGAFAFAFAFSLPAMTQIGHAQLAWRVGVPFCFWFMLRFAEDGAPRHLFGFLIALAFQTLINVYLGVFTAMTCALLLAACFVAGDGIAPRAWWGRLRSTAGRFRRMSGADVAWGAGAFASLIVLGLVMGFHAHVASIYGLGRDWASISPMVARPQSYLMSDFLSYWEPVSRLLPPVPARGEHQIFLGIPLTLLAVLALVFTVIRWREADGRRRAFALCVLFSLLLFTGLGRYSLYWFAAQLPGVDSIRAVTRYMVVLAFPIAVLVALFLADFARHRRAAWLAPTLAALVLAWMAFDLAMFRQYGFSSSESRDRVARVVAATPPDERPFAVAPEPGTFWVISTIDTMLAGQELGRPSLNGYSGSFPPGAPFGTFLCQDALTTVASYDRWATRQGLSSVAALGTDIDTVGMDPCDLSVESLRDLKLTRGKPLDRTEAQLVRLSDLRLGEGEPDVATVRVTNGTDRIIRARTKHPFRLAWRQNEDAGWDTRIGIGPDLGPGQSRDVSFFVPPGTRIEDLSVSFVLEGAFWGHDIGVPPLTAPR